MTIKRKGSHAQGVAREMHTGCREDEGGDGRGPLHEDRTNTKGKGAVHPSDWRRSQRCEPGPAQSSLKCTPQVLLPKYWLGKYLAIYSGAKLLI